MSRGPVRGDTGHSIDRHQGTIECLSTLAHAGRYQNGDGDRSWHFRDRLARPASSYGVEAATYLAIVIAEMVGAGLD